jgi:N-glycosylase/DNA lyase
MTFATGTHELLRHYSAFRTSIRARLADFAAVPPSEYFYELLYCLLTPQSSAVNADAVVQKIRAGGFFGRAFDVEPILRDPAHYIRFHRVKARRLLEARERYHETMRILSSELPPIELREALVRHVNGFGLKEATHFLRNIGRSAGLAILDRHILRNLVRCGVIRSIPPTLTRRRYLQIEGQFDRFARTIGIPLDELDLAFWSMETGEIRK